MRARLAQVVEYQRVTKTKEHKKNPPPKRGAGRADPYLDRDYFIVNDFPFDGVSGDEVVHIEIDNRIKNRMKSL